MHHCKVSVERHECEEEDGAVETYEVGTADHLTQSNAKNPLRHMVRCPEGETGGKENVGEDQIQEQDVCHRVELFILVDDEEDKPIANVTQEEVDIVENWDESCTKLIDTLLHAELDSFTDHIGWVGDVIGFIE